MIKNNREYFNMENTVDVIENYEVVTEKKKSVITYDLSDSKNLVNNESLFVVAKQNQNKNFDLVVSNIEGQDLVVFKDMEESLLSKVLDKKLFIAGLDPKTENIEQASIVENLSIERSNKLKIK